FVLKRALSLGMLIVIGLLLLVSLVVTTLIDEFTAWLQTGYFDQDMFGLMLVLNNILAFGFAGVLFSVAFKFLPDAKIQWRDVWVGAGVTAFLFVVGKGLIGWYLQFSHAGSSWGTAAASLIGVLVWVYYTSLIVLLGAEFTQSWAMTFGSGLKPASGAVLVAEKKEYHSSESDIAHERELTPQ
ncbi:MAG: YihY/virulence factor BrkB family protein, partial [Planctomycetaceae bacterium]|nr:YihY/virulence factor BrkB family protein [Planctomycetaceae bacterium]